MYFQISEQLAALDSSQTLELASGGGMETNQALFKYSKKNNNKGSYSASSRVELHVEKLSKLC